MSKPDTVSVTCPVCKHVFSVGFWLSVNVTLDPWFREKVRSGEIRDHVCPRCSQTLTVNTDLLYHDMTRKFMISYHVVADGRTPSMSADFLGKSGAIFPDYRLRFVVSWNQLREKIAIFEVGLDDMIIEFIKLYVADQAYGHVDFADDTIYFLNKRETLVSTGDIAFEVYRDGKLLGIYGYPLSQYKEVAKQMEQEFGNNYQSGIWKMVNQATIREGT
jgi:hypothetical protein